MRPMPRLDDDYLARLRFRPKVASDRRRGGTHVNWDTFEGNWNQVKGAVREKWGDLTDDDLDRIAGNRDQFIGRLQERYGIMRDQAEREADDFVRDLNNPY
jgi:uncharacterized protein YjbJ (UPF0337 family)